jgi:hypothetical protein
MTKRLSPFTHDGFRIYAIARQNGVLGVQRCDIEARLKLSPSVAITYLKAWKAIGGLVPVGSTYHARWVVPEDVQAAQEQIKAIMKAQKLQSWREKSKARTKKRRIQSVSAACASVPRSVFDLGAMA